MTLLERFLLMIAILEIPLQIDSYLMYHEQDALQGAVGGINVSLTILCLLGAYSIWLIDAATQPARNKISWTFGISGLVYVGTVALSSFSAQVRALALFDVALLVQSYLLFFYIANRVSGKRDVQWIVASMAMSLLVEGFMVVGLAGVSGRMAGESISVGPVNLSVWEDGRPGGTMQSPVAAGSFLAMLMAPVAALLIVPASRRLKWLAALAIVIGGLAVVLTQTRGAIITVFLSFALLSSAAFFKGWLPRWTLAAAMVLAIICAWPIARVIRHRVVDGDAGSAVARKHLSQIALQAIRHRPILGGGAGNCHLICEQFANSGLYRSEWYYTIHCKYLLVWVETGLLGLVAFLAFLLDNIVRGWRTWRAGDPFTAILALALVAGLLGHMVHMAVDIFNARSQVQQLWLCLGLIAALHRLQSAAVQRQKKSRLAFLLEAMEPAGAVSHGT